MRGASVTRDVLRIDLDVDRGATRTRLDDAVVVEEPLEIRIAGEPVAITMRTPGADRELVLGFLLAEGVIASVDDVASIAPCGRPGDAGHGNAIDVTPAPGARLELERLEGAVVRGTVTTSACGVCGRRTIEDLLARCLPIATELELDPARLAAIGTALAAAQPIFRRTGGLHAAGFLDREGRLGPVFEDVGRHNAVDKLVGSQLLGRALDGRWPVLAVSGRASFEIVQKALAARVPVVVAVSAASSLAVDLARRAGLTLAGFARSDRLVVYSGEHRLAPAR